MDHPSATSRAQDRESSPAKDRRSTAVPRTQLEDIVTAKFYCSHALPDGNWQIWTTLYDTET